MSKGKLVAVCIVWLLILGVGVLAWRLLFVPNREAATLRDNKAKQEQLDQGRLDTLKGSSSLSRYHNEIDFHIDSFSGYAIIRSEEFKNQLAGRRIRLNLHDDAADYAARIRALQSGEAQLAVFTIDALVKTSADLGELPASIVCFVDETTGADAIVAYKAQIPNVDALNHSEIRFVLTPASPSETLARVVMARFELNNLPENPFIEVNDSREVLNRYKAAKPGDPRAYVLWEPFVSQMLKNPEMHVVVDSSRFPSAIVDVVVANRDFLLKNPTVVSDFVECYLRAVYHYRDRAKMVELVIRDAKETGSPLTDEDANKLVDGIWWKNTQENLAHVGFLSWQVPASRGRHDFQYHRGAAEHRRYCGRSNRWQAKFALLQPSLRGLAGFSSGGREGAGSRFQSGGAER